MSAAVRSFDHVAIVGGGFSGTMLAINLLRHDGPRVTLIDRRDVFGRGVAYSTTSPAHLLNVRAANMSALPDDPGHFVRWLDARGGGRAQSFASRRDYGDYLAGLLRAEMAARPGRLVLRGDSAVAVERRGEGLEIAFADAPPLAADAVALALGNLPPHDPPGIAGAGLPESLYRFDPWDGDIAEGLDTEDTVLIVGSGLTMIDTVLTLADRGFAGRIVALSRRGLAPRAHAEVTPPAHPRSTKPTEIGAALVREVRARAAAIGWRAAIDELRPFTQAMWLSAPVEEQRRFLRHLRPWWDVHRHRLSPDVAARIAALREAGRLEVVAGKLLSVEPRGDRAAATFRPRYSQAVRRIAVNRIVNCTGPQGDVLRSREPLLQGLLAAGRIRPDRHRLGLDVTAQAETIDADGRADPRLLAIGPMTRGAFWEIVAVPDIRVQAWSVARRLSHAHWVEGEGL